MQKHMQNQMLKLINAIRNETGEFLAEIAGPKEGEARDKMVRALLHQANHAELTLLDRMLVGEPKARLDPEDSGCGSSKGVFGESAPNHLA